MMTDDDRRLLRIAYEEARAGFDEGGCPIGSVLARVCSRRRNHPDDCTRGKKRRPPRNRPVCLYRATSWSARRVGSGKRNPAPQASTQVTLLS